MISRIPKLGRFAVATVSLGLLVTAAGCGSGVKLAPVSGVVTFNGKAYPNAVVSFQPVGGKGNENPGRGSMAVTDADGKFTLKYDNVEPGAVVGKHVVRIVTNGVFTAAEEEGTGSDDATPKNASADPIPPEWFDPNNPKHFDVPAGGTDQANFAIESKKPGKKR
jgi:hypothetical protein